MKQDKPKWITVPALSILSIGGIWATTLVLVTGKVGKGRGINGYYTRIDDPAVYWLNVVAFMLCVLLTIIGLYYEIRRKG